MTNGDKIRQMTDSELALMFDNLIKDCKHCPSYENCLTENNTGVPCKVIFLRWLQERSADNGRLY